MIAQNTKSFFVFSNENHKDTYVERKAGESPNDHNDRAIRTAASWYQSHLKESKSISSVKVVLLSEDQENVSRALREGLTANTVYSYASSISSHPTLIDRVARFGPVKMDLTDGTQTSSKKTLFEDHVSLPVLKRGVESGKYLQGVFHGSRDNRSEGFVAVHGQERWILVRGLSNINRAIDGDVVGVEMFPKDRWTTPSGIVEDDEQLAEKEVRSEVEILPEEERTNSCSEDVDASSVQPTGKVMGIIRKNRRAYCGTLCPTADPSSDRHIFIPADRRVPHIRVITGNSQGLVGKRIVVSVDDWPQYSRIPQGHFVRTLGAIGEKNAENEVLLLEHDVPYQPFSPMVLADLPDTPWRITDEERKKRCDLRRLPICSVDPPGCTDIDDALHCRKLENGNFEVGVHIADVSHFIRPGSALDKEAANRGTTVYLCDKRIDMVPELLSSNLCSLREGEERLAFSCIWELTPSAEVVNTTFTKSVISSKKAFTYTEAQFRIDDASLDDEVTVSLRSLNRLAKILKQKRIESGALTLASPEVRFEIDSETHDPINLETKEMKETNSLVEEFMLLANISVAKAVFKEFPHCALLRRHPSPPLSNYDVLIKAGRGKGVHVAVESAKSLAVSLANALLPSEPYFNTLLRILATRCMMQALYFSSGKIPQEEFYHYGLATPIYTHFTSPIRRYGDLMVHRLLSAMIGADSTYPDLLDKEKMQKLCDRLNKRHKMAQYTQRGSIQLHTQIYFRNNSSLHQAFVLMVKKNSLQVIIPKYGYEGHILLDTPVAMGDKPRKKQYLNTHFNESELSISVEGHIFRVFDPIQVKLVVQRSSIQDSKVVLQLVSPSVRGLSVGGESEQPLSKRSKPND